MDEIKDQIRALDEADWQVLLDWIVGDERQRRAVAPAVSAGQAEVIRELRDKGQIEDPAPEQDEGPAPWKDPGTDHSRMYLLGDRVAHQGRVWTSRVDGLNSWEPGAPGVYSNVWEADPDPEPDPVPETPTEGENEGTTTPGNNVPVAEFKPGEQVEVGDRRAWQGHIWEVVQEHTTALHWTPDVAHSLWKKVPA